jgi:hypothetical protein
MYNWAVNQLKLQLATAKVGKGASEEQVKEMYIKMGGLVRESTPEKVEVEATPEVNSEVVVKPIKRRKQI